MSTALNSLLQKASIEDHDEVLAHCDAILKRTKDDVHTLRIKVVALLQLNRFEDVVRVFDQTGDQLKEQATLEYAYALYKTGDTSKAANAARKLDSRGGQHLQAQVAYRLEDFATASEIYQTLAKQPRNEVNDIRINLNATYAQLVWKGNRNLVKKIKAEREDLEGFETAYNAACLLIARGELGQAEVLLRRAKDLCSAADELSAQQKEEELLNISVQQLYVLITLGKIEAAEQLAGEIASDTVPDVSIRRISTINKLVAARGGNPYLTQRLLENVPSLPVNDQLFGFQELLVNKNDVAVDLACSKIEGIKRSTAKEINSVTGPSLDSKVNLASTANAAAHAQNQLGKAGLKAILPLLDKRPHDVGLLATIIQLYVLTGNNGAAIHVVEKFLKKLDDSSSAAEQDIRYSPGLLAIAVSLYALEGRKSLIENELAKAASYWKAKQKPPPDLLKAASVSLLVQDDPDDIKLAGEIFELLRKTYPGDKIIKAGLAASLPDFPQKSTTDFLTPIERLTAGIDVAALETAGIPRSSTSAAAALLKRKRAEPSSTKQSKKRIRKSQLPKDFDPNKKMDPERWLPLRDRSTYRPKGKRGKQKQSAATQGTSEKPSDGIATPERSTVATASTNVGGKAKKKKGKK